MMTMADQLIQQGVERGRQEESVKSREDIATRLLRESQGLSLIARVTDISVERLQELQTELL